MNEIDTIVLEQLVEDVMDKTTPTSTRRLIKNIILENLKDCDDLSIEDKEIYIETIKKCNPYS